MISEVVIIDYKLGNLFSIKQAIQKFGVNAVVTNELDVINSAKAIVLPGVGAFGHAMNQLRRSRLDEALVSAANKGVPLFGICLGMQLLCSQSEEYGEHKGLGIIPGTVKKFPSKDSSGNKVRVPSIGWRTLIPNPINNWDNSPFSQLNPEDDLYFVHSYHVAPDNPESILAESIYSEKKYCAAIKYQNIFSTQFHPEKSGKVGLQIIKNWLDSLEV